jgi:hypothetical protein
MSEMWHYDGVLCFDSMYVNTPCGKSADSSNGIGSLLAALPGAAFLGRKVF